MKPRNLEFEISPLHVAYTQARYHTVTKFTKEPYEGDRKKICRRRRGYYIR